VPARQEDFLFAEHALRRGFATEEQVQECLQLLERLRDEMQLEETLPALLLKKGYIAPAQAAVVEQAISPAKAGGTKNQIEGYRLLARLGAGAMGSVYKAHHLKLDIPVALKVLRLDLASNRTQVERLKREAQLAARLNHPNIVRGIDVGESNGFHYFAMEYVEGTTVRDLLRKRPLKEKEALRIVRDVARALEHAHAHGVIHRDVKPGNIMITPAGVAKLADFGLARGQTPSDLTLEHASIGTPQYLAPEQARRGSDATERSDLFGLGASLYHMVVGRPPFSGENLGEIFQKVLRGEFEPPEAVVRDLSLDTLYLIHRLMRANPRERYPSATALLADLEALERNERIAPPAFKGDYRDYLARRRARRLALGAAAAAVLVAAFAAIWWKLASVRAEDRRLELCRAADAYRAGIGEELEDPEMLRKEYAALRAKVEEAGATCSPSELAGLVARAERLRADAAVLEDAAKRWEACAQPDADFRAIDAALGAMAVESPGAARRLARLRQAVRDASDAAAARHFERVYGAGAPATVVDLEDLAAALRDRYLELPGRSAATVDGHAKALRRLEAEREAAERDHGAQFDAALKRGDFRQAAAGLRRLQEALDGALQRARSLALPEKFLSAGADDRRTRLLEDAEEAAWGERRLRAAAQTEARPDLVVKELEEFQGRAFRTLEEVGAALARARQRLAELEASQAREVETAARTFWQLAGQRRYAEAARLLRDESRRKEWIAAPGVRISRLRALGDTLDEVRERFWANVRTRRDLAVGGARVPAAAIEVEDDEFAWTAQRERRRASLADVDGTLLLDVLAFDEGDRAQARMRAGFEAAEAAGSADPHERSRRLAEASRFATRADAAFRDEVNERLTEAQAACDALEKKARAAEESFLRAKQEKDHALALDYCNWLLSPAGGLYSTLVTDPKRRADLQRERDALRILVGDDEERLRLGVPRANFHSEVGSGRRRVLFDFTPFEPLAGEAPTHLAPEEREGWAAAQGRRFWEDRRQRWKANRILWETWFGRFPEWSEDPERFRERARLQMLAFAGCAYDAEHAAIREEGPFGENGVAWMRNETPARAIRLRNPFAPTRDVSLEFTVAWYPNGAWDPWESYEDLDANGRRDAHEPFTDEPAYPVYFAATIGGIQACVVALPVTGGPESGRGKGMRLVVRQSLTDRAEQDLDAFRHGASTKKLPPGGSEFCFEHRVPYRVRLERKEDRVLFFAAPLAEWERYRAADAPRATLRRSKAELDAAMTLPEEGRVFRFFGLAPYRIDDVVIEGFDGSDDA
jgi:predicted Ser/Thr protein kinase